MLDAEKIDQTWSTHTLSRRYRMSTLDEITKEKQRVSEALARVDAQHEKLVAQLSELEATERVLARYGTGTPRRKMASAGTPAAATKAAAPARPRGRRRATTAKSAAGKRTSPSLNDRFLRWQLARHSRKLPPRARGLARTMSAPRLPGTNGQAASKSATGNFTPHSALRGQKSPLSPQKNQRRREPNNASTSVKHAPPPDHAACFSRGGARRRVHQAAVGWRDHEDRVGPIYEQDDGSEQPSPLEAAEKGDHPEEPADDGEARLHH